MARVTSKLQVTVPKAIADKYGILPGDEIEWVPAGDAIRVVRPSAHALSDDRKTRLHLFDQATKRHARRRSQAPVRQPRDRGWKREDLYTRGRTR